ncbi:hypothetical protein ROLI_006360 [Roseobacter fucihabitans]|uniref:Putative DNA-binding domain-containing protein n=1 Tax=Roseobacter fucihabitans TaxID=1537242 RepID=A0ABZ2BQ36_9RHOB|nr:DNA-binding domain-containing protein [Roseobacter litoralis]MBC6966255.1 hypothetical protein [Roseobacter litoralis]
MNVSQSDFRAAVLDPNADVPEGVLSPGSQGAGNRFSVYRNNVVTSLMDALHSGFPLVNRLLGGSTFAKVAAIYVREHPPQSPLMMFYGAEFPRFLESFLPLSGTGYLADCARLDLAMRQSYHAADSGPIDPGVFNNAPGQLLSLRFSLAPSTFILRSRWPLHDIWRKNFEKDAPAPRSVAQDVMITRPSFDPTPVLLAPGASIWLDHLARGVAFGEAVEKTAQTLPDFDLTQALTQALQTGALTEFKTKET